MDDARILSLLTLSQMSDSAFPSGGFAFSQGLETLLAERTIQGEEALGLYLEHQLQDRWLVFDRYFLTESHGLAEEAQARFELDRECEAMSPVASLREGSRRNGLALLTSHERIGTAGAKAYKRAVAGGEAKGHLPVVQGLLFKGRGLALLPSLVAAAHGFLAGQVSAAVRLGAIGTLGGQRILTGLQPALAAALAAPLPPEAPWSFTPMSEIAAMRHETQGLRLFTN